MEVRKEKCLRVSNVHKDIIYRMDSIYRMQHFTYDSRVSGTEWQENEQELQVAYEETSINTREFRIF